MTSQLSERSSSGSAPIRPSVYSATTGKSSASPSAKPHPCVAQPGHADFFGAAATLSTAPAMLRERGGRRRNEKRESADGDDGLGKGHTRGSLAGPFSIP